MKNGSRAGVSVSGRRGLFLLVVLTAWLAMGATSQGARIKDLAVVKGVRDNQLVGYGLVVGLKGTGDSNRASFTTQGLANMLENLGVHVAKDDLRVKNVAGVMITAKLPAFAKPGQKIDVLLSSLGDARSLQGGNLVATQLKGLDNMIYAMAQGAVVIGGTDEQKHETVGRIPGGATVEKDVPVSWVGRETITLTLNNQDFTTVSRMVRSVDSLLGGPYAVARDGATVDVKVPELFKNNEVSLLAALENLEVEPDSIARVILDERTGTVVMGDNIRLGRMALSHGNLSIKVGGEEASGEQGSLLTIEHGTSLGEVVRALNSIGVTPRDMVSIFQSIKASGALQAELEII
ncbi:MAG: flagellar basal body P-ring protein FlgI [Proteobacteria bacterium]|nr:flagellar basal body P-ring protein FlgI [Pseudomonadota bacterium]MBU1737194.1 flagellar basal body P-ring protein FlgI [Pseudomonadota bacterium]